MTHQTAQNQMEETIRKLKMENERLTLTVESLQQAANEVAKQQPFMRPLIDELPASVYFKDTERRFVLASNYFCKRFGCRPEAIIGKKDEDLFPPEFANASATDDRRVIETGTPLIDKEEGGEWFKDGGHWVLTTKLPWRDSKGKIIGLFGIAKDISDHKRTETMLRESEEKFKSLAEQSPNMIFVNQKGRVVYANQQCVEMMEYTTDEFYAEDFDFLTIIAPEYTQLIKRNFMKHMNGQEISPYEYALVNKSGRRIEAIITTKLINYGRQSAILGIVTDITERKRAEEKLREKDLRLEQQTKNLQEMNVALKVLLEQREKEKIDFKENLLVSMQKLVFPYIEKLQHLRLDDESKTFIDIISANLESTIAPMANSLTATYLGLTPTEVKVADLIKQGKSSKEIATILHVSPKAVSFHRGNIRKKLGLRNKKINLYTYLQSMSAQTSS